MLPELLTRDPLLIGGSFALGLLIGSFLNVVIHRVPRNESIVHPPSRCPGCSKPIRPWDNIPVLSYLWLRGRCRSCGIRIPLRYPAIEALTGLVFAGIALRYGLAPMTPLWMIFAAALIAAAVIDFDHQIIPDEISLGGLLLGLAFVPLARSMGGESLSDASVHSGVGALLGGGMLWLVGFVHARICVATGRTFAHWPGEGEALPRPSSLDYWIWFPGLGFGDVKLLAMIGAFVGPVGVLETIVLASLLGLLLGVGWAMVVRNWNSPFGFGPALVAGALVVALSPYRVPFPG